MHGPRQPSVSLSSTSKGARILNVARYTERYRGRAPLLYPFPLHVSGLTKMSVILLCIIKSTLSKKIKGNPAKPLM